MACTGKINIANRQTELRMATVDLSDEAREALESVCDRTGLPKKVTVSRVLEWFADQTEITQALILALIPEAVQGSAAEIALAAIRDRARDEASGSLADETEQALWRAKRAPGRGA
jgi:hypothetical protein